MERVKKCMEKANHNRGRKRKPRHNPHASGYERRQRKRRRKEEAKPCTFDKSVKPSESAKRCMAASVAGQVQFSEMSPEDKEKVSLC